MEQNKDFHKGKFKDLSKGIEYIMNWNMTNLCNFRCEYCGGTEESYSKPHQDVGKYSVDQISESFSRDGRNWMIYFNGGEPFLYPDFINLASTLSKQHKIALNTNLSSESVYRFADEVNPESVILIHAAFHLGELEKRKEGVKKYIEKYLYLQQKGFNIVLSYISYPPYFKRLEKDFSFFREMGMNQISVKTFKGSYDGNTYPESYTPEQREMINKYSIFSIIDDIAAGQISHFKKICSAGTTFFIMDISGNLKRCSSIAKSYGNFFEGTYKFDDRPRPCTARICNCGYHSDVLVQENKSSFLFYLSEIIQENSRKIWKQL